MLLEEPVVGLDGLFAAVEAVVELGLELQAGHGAGGLAGHSHLQGLQDAQGVRGGGGCCAQGCVLGACPEASKKDDDGSVPLRVTARPCSLLPTSSTFPDRYKL